MEQMTVTVYTPCAVKSCLISFDGFGSTAARAKTAYDGLAEAEITGEGSGGVTG